MRWLSSGAVMQAEQLANLFERSSREGKAWRARCPVHKSTGLTLAIYADDDRCNVHCFAGCKSDDILKAVGLTWKDTLYEDKTLSPAEKRAWAQKKRIDEAYRWEKFIQQWTWLADVIEKYEKKPHLRLIRTKSRFEVDIDRYCARIIASQPAGASQHPKV